MLTHSRRNFIKIVSASALTSAVYSQSSSAKQETAKSSRIKDWIIFDGLGGLYNPNPPTESELKIYKENPFYLSETFKRDIVASGVTCIRVTSGATYPSYPGMDAFRDSVKTIAGYHKIIDNNNDLLMLAKSVDDILLAKKRGLVALSLGFQNSHVLGNDLDNVDLFRNLGVLTMQLTYNGKNQLGGGANVSARVPLSKFGHEAVEKMNDSDVLIDLSHSGERTCIEAIKASKSAVTISHSGCRALADFPRNKTDEEMRLLASKGGVFGLYFMPFLAPDSRATSEHLIAHIEHALNVCGEDHVALGTDGGYVDINDIEKVRERTALFTKKRIDEGNAAAGEKEGNVNLLPDIAGKKQFVYLAEKLVKRGHSEHKVEKIFGKNALKLMKDVWGH